MGVALHTRTYLTGDDGELGREQGCVRCEAGLSGGGVVCAGGLEEKRCA
jgi:hypothetical protein